MKRKISLLALLLILILVSSCAKNNPFSVNDTTNNNDSSILPDDDAGSIPPESNGGIQGISLDTTKILGIYSSEHTFYTLDENLYRNRWHAPMNVTITKIETGSGIEITIDFGDGDKFSFKNFTGSIKEGTYYLESRIFGRYRTPYILHIVFDCKDYLLKRATLMKGMIYISSNKRMYAKKTSITFVKKPLPQ